MDVKNQTEELLKLSISGNTIKALLRAYSSEKLLDKFLRGNEVQISFHQDGVIIYLDEKYITGWGLKFFEQNSVIKITSVKFQISTLKDDLMALLIGLEDDLTFCNFHIDIYLVENGHCSQFWATIQVGAATYEIDILEYSYKKYGVEIPVDVSSKDKVKIQKTINPIILKPSGKSEVMVMASPSRPTLLSTNGPAESPKPQEKKVILPKEEPDTKTKENDEDICKICMENDLCTVNLPCGHMQFCIGCAHLWKKNICPSCNTEITEIKKVFK